MTWASIACRQGGVITRAQLRLCGHGDEAIDHLLAVGALDVRCTGVFAARGSPFTYSHRLWIAVLATRGILGFATAAHLWGANDAQPALVDVAVGHERRVAIPAGVRLHRVRVPPTMATHRDGLPVTCRSWTVLDHLGRLSHSDAYRLADRALQRGWITPELIRERLREFPGRTGNRTLRLIEARAVDGAAAESERVLHRLLRRADVGRWEANHPIWHDGELIGVADVALVGERIVIEADGWAYHSDIDSNVTAPDRTGWWRSGGPCCASPGPTSPNGPATWSPPSATRSPVRADRGVFAGLWPGKHSPIAA